MSRAPLLAAIVGLSIVNGLVSPVLLPQFWILAALSLAPWQPGPAALGQAASLDASIFTIALAGVPAALYERLARRRQSTTVSLLIWLCGVLALSAPALLYLARGE